eukprot:2947062-Rhodomonas_salina.1
MLGVFIKLLQRPRDAFPGPGFIQSRSPPPPPFGSAMRAVVIRRNWKGHANSVLALARYLQAWNPKRLAVEVSFPDACPRGLQSPKCSRSLWLYPTLSYDWYTQQLSMHRSYFQTPISHSWNFLCDLHIREDYVGVLGSIEHFVSSTDKLLKHCEESILKPLSSEAACRISWPVYKRFPATKHFCH